MSYIILIKWKTKQNLHRRYNIKLRIPPLFYNSIDVTIDGIKFTVRTGPWKIYVKCDKENVPVGSFQFAFDVVDSNDPILSSIHYYE